MPAHRGRLDPETTRVAGPGPAIPLLLILSLSLIPSACLTPEEAVAEVDAEAYDIVAGKQVRLLGDTYAFSVEPRADRLTEQVIDPETGLARPGTRIEIDLEDALRIAARNSREFQEQKELLYRDALDLMRERESFRATPSSPFDASVSKTGDVDSVAGDGEFGLTRFLERGGSYAVAVGLSFLRVFSSPTSEDLTSFLDLSISLPFLRNAGREIVIENLTQADRNVLYGLRTFERFKQTYGVQVISTYLRLLSQKRRIENEEANLESLRFARRRNEEYFAEGRIATIEVDQARQQELQGENRLVVTRQDLERSLDSFKELVGLPTDLEVEVRLEDLEALEQLMAEDLDFDVRRLVSIGLTSRLDFRNAVDTVADAGRRVRVAENQLLPDLTLDLFGRVESETLKPLKYDLDDGTYSASLDFDAGLDRDLESISLRSSILDLQRTLRSQEAFRDQVVFEVQEALRNLLRARESYRISRRAVELAEQRVASSREFLELGRASTRDFLESQEALISNQNEMVANLVEFRIAYLEPSFDLRRRCAAILQAAHERGELGLYAGPYPATFSGRDVYFNATVTALAALGVFIGGATWSWLYLRYRNIYAAYVSHVFADVIIFLIGYLLIFGGA